MHASPPVALPRSRSRAVPRLRRPELAGLVLLAALLNLWALGRNGMANEYYSAAVKAMASDWHAFLYGSFDASGVMTVDKPPLGLWVQALSARAFGFSSLSLLVPQALMGAATVALTYDLVARRFGRAAGTVGGLVLALTPITVAISRHNNPDALLILCSVAALWATARALETGGTRWLVWAGVFVGLGFETKMAAALMVVPGIVASYLWVAPRGRPRAVSQLAAGGAAMTVAGLAWPVLMWVTPASSRPWISGTADNSIWSLILGYNGLGRLFGQSGTVGGGMGGGGGMFGGDSGSRDCSTRASAARPAGGWASRSSLSPGSPSPPAAGVPTPAPAGCSPSAAPSWSPRSPSVARRGSSTPTTCPCSRRSRRRWPAPGGRSAAAGWPPPSSPARSASGRSSRRPAPRRPGWRR